MDKKKKRGYESPTTVIVEIETERILCLSDPQYNNPFNGGEDW